MASEKLKEMKDAVFRGQGQGLQETSQIAGEVMGESSDMRGSKGKKADEASVSLGKYGQGAPGPTTADTPIKASDQVVNMQTGSADHLDMGFRKQS